MWRQDVWWPACVGRRDTVVWRGRYLGTVRVRVWIGHVGGHVAVVLVVMRASPAALLVHVRVVCVCGGHRVEVVGGIVGGGGFARAGGAVGRGRAELVKATEHVRLHLEGHGRAAAVLVHQLHGGGVVVHVVGHGRGVLGVKLHVG